MSDSFLIKDGVLGIRNKTDLHNFISQLDNKEYDFSELVDLFLSDNLRICQSASWPMGIFAAENPDIVIPYLDKILTQLDKAPHDAYVRNTFRFLQFMDVPEAFQGKVYEKCFDALINTSAPTAIKAFALTTLSNLAMKLPELKEELIEAIYEQIPYGTSGFQNRAKKEINRLSRKSSS